LIITLVLITVILFPLYAHTSYAAIPINVNLCDNAEVGTNAPFVAADRVVDLTQEESPSVCVQKEFYMTVNINFPVFVVYVMTFIGWFFLCFFLPTGFWAIPFDLIAGWAKRPKLMSEKDFSTAKSSLGADIGRLIDQGKRVNEEKEKAYKKSSPCDRYAAKVTYMKAQH
jgi:hypothetical protein